MMQTTGPRNVTVTASVAFSWQVLKTADLPLENVAETNPVSQQPHRGTGGPMASCLSTGGGGGVHTIRSRFARGTPCHPSPG